jgi:hypothetical protein
MEHSADWIWPLLTLSATICLIVLRKHVGHPLAVAASSACLLSAIVETFVMPSFTSIGGKLSYTVLVLVICILKFFEDPVESRARKGERRLPKPQSLEGAFDRETPVGTETRCYRAHAGFVVHTQPGCRCKRTPTR